MNIVFENPSFLAVDKPHGWLTTPAREASDARTVLGLELQKERGTQIYPVHRLDFEVSGLVLFALNREAHMVAQSWFENSLVKKTYQAWSKKAGGFPRDWEDWHSRLVRGKRRSFEAAHGKDSITRARVVEERNEFLRWELMPATGRPHQLRFEMAKHGFAILGDTLYGGEPGKDKNRIALRAVAIDFSGCGERMGLPEKISVEDLSWS
jgi:tRNA pseudouridine32 synthase / 23S rRNA pseudouridine746 synthase